VAQDLAVDGGRGERQEVAAAQLEPVDGVHQPDCGDLSEIVEILAPVGVAARDGLCHGRVAGDDRPARCACHRGSPERRPASSTSSGVRCS
jgi:hypothetical protein